MADPSTQAAKAALGTACTETFEVISAADPTLRGRFVVSLPTQLDKMRMGVRQAQLREGVPLEQLDLAAAGLCIMLSTLEVVVRDAPAWWWETVGEGTAAMRVAAPGKVRESDVLWDLYGRYVAFRDSFRAGGGSQPAAGGTGAASLAGGQGSGAPPA